MALRWSVRHNAYYDSVKLMRVSEALNSLPGIQRAAVAMATPLNVELLRDDGLLPADVRPGVEDLLITILGENEEVADHAVAQIDSLLQARTRQDKESESVRIRSVEEATDSANLAVIAVPGAYAAAEAYAALRAGLHVFLFSDNVALVDEIRLKHLAVRKGLLMMGPDCGTAIIDGVGLGFANRVDAGPVGIIGASGTGIQQVCCLLDLCGIGVTQAIGTGGRDLSADVDGIMTRHALDLLEADPAVKIIVLISKPADDRSIERLHHSIARCSKPVIACLLGQSLIDQGSVRYVRTTSDAARLTIDTLGGHIWSTADIVPDEPIRRPGQRVYGLFAGGTLKSEAAAILSSLDVPHTLIDLGDDEYTRGRAHPIIDPRLRASMLTNLAERRDVGTILLDVILGDLAHPDPANALLPAIRHIQERSDGSLPVIVVLIGTRNDPQGLERQRHALEDAGVRVFPDTMTATRAAAMLSGGIP